MPLRQEVDHRTPTVLQVGHWSQSLHQDYFIHVLWPFTGHDPEHNRSLRMSNIMYLANTCIVQDVVNGAGNIMFAHLMERKVPELGVVGAVLDMFTGVGIAPDIRHPDVVALVVEQVTFGTE